MRIQRICTAAVMSVVLAVIAPGQESAPLNSEGPSKVAHERVKCSNGTYTRITGRVKVLNTHTLRFVDGTEVDLRYDADALEPEQKGLIGETLYPCGKEASEFLAKMIGDKPVAFFIDGNVVPGKTPHGKAFVGEMHLQLEMVRNGWMVSAHSGMDIWEIIARENKRGLWRGEFVPPKRWRKGERLPGEDTALR
jgi:endonuclease YncB( thermonuclease family)